MEVGWDEATNTASLTSSGQTTEQSNETAARQGTLIADNERARITFHGVETSNRGENILVFMAENKTDRVLTFQSDAMSVDGIGIGHVSGSSSVPPQSSGLIRFSGRDSFTTTNPTTITGNIRILDMDSQPREERWERLVVEFQNVSLR